MKNIRIIVLVAFFCTYYITANSAEQQVPTEVKKTEVVIVGTIHTAHYKNPKYSPEVLKEIIFSLKPNVILNELPLSLVDPNGRPIEKIRGRESSCPEIWAADKVAMELGIKQIPYDRPDREENFKKTNYFEKQKRSNEMADKWGYETIKKDPNSLDVRIVQLMSYAGQAEGTLFMNSGPEIINSEAHDSVVRIKHSLWHDIMPAILKKYPGYETLIDDYCFEKQQWIERNRIMVDNIIKAAKEYPGKRLVVVTGATHRYFLRDLLNDVNSIALKEYWEITSSDVKKGGDPNEHNNLGGLVEMERHNANLYFLSKL